MTRSSITTGLLAAGAALVGTVGTPACARAGGCDTTIYNNYGNAAYYTTTNVSYTNNNVGCARGGTYVPANYGAGFMVPQPAPAACGAAYREPGYALPAYRGGTYAQPVYTGTRYVEPVRRTRTYVAAGRSRGHSKIVHHRKVHRSRKVIRQRTYVPRRSGLHVRYHKGPGFRHRPHHVRHHFRPDRSHRWHRPHRGGFHVSFGRRR